MFYVSLICLALVYYITVLIFLNVKGEMGAINRTQLYSISIGFEIYVKTI